MREQPDIIGLLDVSALRELALPSEQYAVFGSGPMAAAGIRKSRDIDIVVTPELFAKLRSGGDWQERAYDDDVVGLVCGNIEAFQTWNYETYRPDVIGLIAQAEMIQGIPFVPLAEVRAWKAAFGRKKDIADVVLIDAFLQKKD